MLVTCIPGDVLRILSLARLNRVLRIYKMVSHTHTHTHTHTLYLHLSVFLSHLHSNILKARLLDQQVLSRKLSNFYKIYFYTVSTSMCNNIVYGLTNHSREIKFAIYMSLGTHLTACGWFLLACSSISAGANQSHICGTGSWALRYSSTPLSESLSS